MLAKSPKPETTLERLVWKWAKEYDEESPQQALEDVTHHGCQSGIVGRLIYYTDTLRFYKRHRKEINGLLVELVESTGESPQTLFRDWDKEDPLGQDTQNQNLLAWFGFEETARALLDRMEEER